MLYFEGLSVIRYWTISLGCSMYYFYYMCCFYHNSYYYTSVSATDIMVGSNTLGGMSVCKFYNWPGIGMSLSRRHVRSNVRVSYSSPCQVQYVRLCYPSVPMSGPMSG